MVRRTVRILCSAILFSLCLAFAKEDTLTEESIRELAESYLENTAVASEGSLTAYYPIVPNGSCGTCFPSAPCTPNYPSEYMPCGPECIPCTPQGPMHEKYMEGDYDYSPPQEQQQGPAPLRIAPPHPQSTLEKTNGFPPPSDPQGGPVPRYDKPNCGAGQEGYTINFKDISVIELIQFISKISNTNYIFNSADLQFTITIVSEDPTSVTDLSAALLQILKTHDLSVSEQGNNVLIYKNQDLASVSTVITDDNVNDACDTAIITRVFRLFNVKPEKVAKIISPLLSRGAVVEPSIETNHLIVTDITANVNKITDLLRALDTPTLSASLEEYTARNADPRALVAFAGEILNLISSPEQGVSLVAEPNTGKIFIIGSPFLINKAKQVLASLDVAEVTVNSLNTITQGFSPTTAMENNNFYMYKLKYQNGQEIADALREVGTNLQYTGVGNMDFINTIYSIQWVEVNNSIIVTGTEDSIDKVVALLNDLDQAPKQVYIEVLIIDTFLQNSLDFGVQWIALGEEQNKLAFASGLLANSPPAASLQSGARTIAATDPPAAPLPNNVPTAVPGNLFNTNIAGDVSDLLQAFSFGIIGNVISHGGRSFLTLGALMSALDEEQDTSIVLNPKIMVEDTQPANFFVGQNIPYQTTSTVIQQTGSVTQNIQYEDIGVQLQVTPTISPNNIVTLQINQTVAEVVSTGNLTPTTNKTLATTRVHVPDGTFLVMSGHVRDQCEYIRSGIPCLGTLPLIGPAFSRTIEARSKRNLIFFIRPKVVTSIQEGVCLTNTEGYEYNWQSSPCSLRDCCGNRAPECESYPAPPLCPWGAQKERPRKGERTPSHHRRDYYSDHNFDDEEDQELDRINGGYLIRSGTTGNPHSPRINPYNNDEGYPASDPNYLQGNVPQGGPHPNYLQGNRPNSGAAPEMGGYPENEYYFNAPGPQGAPAGSGGMGDYPQSDYYFDANSANY